MNEKQLKVMNVALQMADTFNHYAKDGKTNKEGALKLFTLFQEVENSLKAATFNKFKELME